MSIGRTLGRLPAQLQHQHIRTLEASFKAASNQFGSYNFREYFGRKSRQKFDEQLPKLLGTRQINDETLARMDPKTRQEFDAWWSASVDELAVIERASIMNRLFLAPKLVVESAPSFPDASDNKSSGNLPNDPSEPKNNT
ncbi:hypothetical protein PGT21_011030 [Puccinia graminis f. sp. tritici]|uniref:Uncharacterized protein n=1 Tax=Puccinia graminis f. sp. tritici TaxID=56615 RepID=A0A5B0P7R4_PUCGR|nr:hypothetical protein PGT21_011030 [Puccinia graminis f. sp. tritici]KAA1134079.1 hypothetical protein PGTUg99_024524 [Puccinia graminis f. sp. tritici]